MKKFLLFAFLFVFSSCQDEENIPTLSNDQTAQQLDKGAKVVVCHKTGKGTFIPLEISINALPAHLAHGDYVPDADGDGYTAIGSCTGSMNDCDDANPAINPGATEVCDDIDNNCDGNIDEGFDVDGDGYKTCEDDCDDSDATIYPGAEEVCGDNKDNDCDGLVDEGCCPSTVIYEGKTYNTVQIGEQCWLKENLDVGTRIDGSQNQNNDGVIQKYCYNNDPNNCNTYGGLYQWNEAMKYVTTQCTRGICPPEWHIPTLAEFQVLSNAVSGDGNALKAVGQGSGAGAGTNTSGFSALLAGHRFSDANFYKLGFDGCFWSSNEFDVTFVYNMNLYHNISFLNINYDRYKDNGFSVRCLKD